MQLPRPTQTEFEIPQAGTFPARCYRFLDLGTQPKTFQGQTKLTHQVRLSWELPTELTEKGDHVGKPFSIHNQYTWSMGDKAILRKTLESWRGKKFTDTDFGETGFNTKKLIGISCMLGVTHTESKGKVYANITSVSPLLKGYDMPPQINESLYFSFDEAMSFNGEERKVYLNNFISKISQATKDAIYNCPEYKKAMGIQEEEQERESPPLESYDDSIPF